MDFLRKCPDVAITLSDTYRYIMVDEYQDTNALQDKILHKLCCTHQNLAVVGDDSQSLYGFRGSSPESILHFPDKIDLRLASRPDGVSCGLNGTVTGQRFIDSPPVASGQ